MRAAPSTPHNSRALGLARNLPIAVATSLRSIAADPLTFAIQLGRRFPQLRASRILSTSAVPAGDRAVLEAWLNGDLATTRLLLDELAGRSTLSRLSAEVAQAAGRPELVVDDHRAHPVARARAAWKLGEATQAIALLAEFAPRSRLHRALRAELALLTPGARLRWDYRGPASSPDAGDRVLHLLTNSLPHTQSGYTVRTHAVLKAQHKAGLAPVAMSRLGYPVIVGRLTAMPVDVIDEIAYHRALPHRLAPTPDGRLIQQADALAALACRVRPGVLQTTTHYPNAIVTSEVARALDLPWAYEVRGMLEHTWVAGLASEEARERAVSSERFRLTREREAELASQADAVFTLSAGMRDDLAARGVPRERVHLVPNGIDAARLERTPPSPDDAREVLGLPREGFWVGSTSSLVEYEGFDILIEAVRLAREQGHDIRMLLVGDGTARPALEARAAEAGLTDATRFTGRVRHEAIVDYGDALDLFVVPRHDRQLTRTVSPLKPVEAMASGRPLLVSALPPLLEIIGEGLNQLGVSVPPGDPEALSERIVELSTDEAARAALQRRARMRAAEFTWDAAGATYRRELDAVRGKQEM